MNTSNVTVDLSANLQLYQFFALAFYEPNASVGSCFTDRQYWQNVSLALQRTCGTGEKMIGSLSSIFLEFAKGKNPVWDDLFQELRVEYNRLFVGPAPPPCPPYESVYSLSQPEEQRGTVYGPSTLAMENALKAEKLAITLDHAQFADHIAIELEFMYYLLDKASRATPQRRVYSEKARQFFSAHLAPWLPDFGDKLVSAACHPFYVNIGNLLALFIRSEEASR